MDSYFRRNILENHIVVAMAIALLGFVVWDLRGVFIALFLAYILFAALFPVVEKLKARGMGHGLAVVLVFVGLLLSVVVLVLPLFPFVASQIGALVDNFPDYLGRVAVFLGLSHGGSDIVNVIKSEFNAVGRNVFILTGKAFNGLFSLTTVVIVGFYLLFYYEKLVRLLISFFGQKSEAKVRSTVNEINVKLGAWVRGQAVLSLIIGAASWIGLSLLGIPFALPLAILAGALEIIPIMGPIVSAIPPVIIALTIDTKLALAVVGLYIVVQLLENNILVPKVMQEAVGLNPLAVILGIMIGGSLLGVVGALLAVPTVLVVSSITRQHSSFV